MRKLNLVTDIGNTSISVGFFEKETLVTKCRFKTKEFEIDPFIHFLEKFIKDNKIDKSEVVDGIISSVVPRLSRLIQICITTIFGVELPFLKNEDNKFIKLDVDEPDTIGGDLLADIIAAKQIYGYPSMIIDLGTITKVLVINKKGDFDRAAFFPGMHLCLDAMNKGTELLPELQHVTYPKDFFGKNTMDAMNSGIYFCTAASIIRLVEVSKYIIAKNTKVIISGGYSELMADYIKDQIIDPNLTLKGLNLVVLNKKK